MLSDVSIVQFFGSLVGILIALVTLIWGMIAFMSKSLKDDVREMFDNLKENVRIQIEAGTEEHREFRQRLEKHDVLFLEIGEKIGEIKGTIQGMSSGINTRLDTLISLQKEKE